MSTLISKENSLIFLLKIFKNVNNYIVTNRLYYTYNKALF